ncbi:efflux RND transporter permease subunit [Jannaschia sp. LMIT008]|uniref:efflux RND transporter permease subunit n=1 Tax=Jannaschia maritima TaxID=3032585 RepID=UPI0028124EE7|nr:efflux RND transporter permease subunit [Jannaschia sp. LMIT008]
MLRHFTRHRTLANLLMVLMIAAGTLAIPNMRAQFFPDVVSESITITTRWDGAGAQDVDRGIVQVLLPGILGIDGVSDVSATAQEGSASITAEFAPGQDMTQAAADMQESVDSVTDLPEDADDPRVRQGNWWDRVTDVVISGPIGVEQLARFADGFNEQLFAAGVTRTTLRGVAAPSVTVEVPSELLQRHALGLAEIAAAIRAEATAAPVGDVTGADARVRAGANRRTAEEVAAIVLRRDADGATLTVGDVAVVRTRGADRERAYFVDGNPAVTMRVDRSADGDAIALQRIVEREAAAALDGAPDGVRIDLINTRAEAITGRIGVLVDNAVTGLALVVALLFLFLNVRTAFWVAAGIPTALMAALALMWAAGLTINMISLFALIITLGIVVDDAIVVGEHADWRARHLREPPVQAAENAARRMFTPVLSATLTTVIAFFGLVAIGGRFGNLIADIPFTVIAVLIASLVECFLILPHHMAGALRHMARETWYDAPSRVVNRGFDWFRDTLFRPLVRLFVTARYAVVAGAVVLLASQAALFLTGEVQWRFFNAPERSSVTGNFAMRDEATREDSMAQLREMQRAVAAISDRYADEYGADPVRFVLGEVGGNSGRGLASADDKDPDQLGGLSIELIDADLRPYSAFALVADLQDEVRQLPLTEEISFRGWRGGPGGDALSVRFSGADIPVLKAAAEDLKAAVARFPEVSGVQDSLPYDRDEQILTLTPQGQALGFDIAALSRTLRDRLSGIEAASFPVGPRTGTIRVELPPGDVRADFLDTLRLTAPGGADVALADIVTVEVRQGFARILREDGVAVVTVTGDMDQDDAARAAEIRDSLSDDILPAIAATHRVDWSLGGLAEQERAFLTDATVGLVACLLGIYLVLAWIFASWSRPAVIMAVIPFGLIGAIWGHWWWDVPLSMFSVVGLIGMTGIIINDSIVLVTSVDEHGCDRALIPAIQAAVADRLRPVLLTTLTTVLGLTPLLYETSVQAQFLRPTVITLVYGLGFGMLLVLVLVPALLAIGGDTTRAWRALGRAARLPRRRRGRGAGLAVMGLAAILAGWAVATLGFAAANRPLPLGLPADGMAEAAALFLSGTAIALTLAWIAGAAVLLRRSRPS